ncbi:MAG: PAS domain-containing protein [Schwartzia sp.]|nr:PAS domain-containing protein [Schwartzia sp. (in: firmicutes)]
MTASHSENNQPPAVPGRSDSLLEKILDTTQAKIFWKDANRRFLGANKAFLDYYGLKPEDIIGRTDEDIGWNLDEADFKNDELRVLQGESFFRHAGRCYCRGVARDIVASKSPLYEDGRIAGLVGSFEDVTEEHRHQDENLRLRQILENVPAGLCLYQCQDEGCTCLMVNEYFTLLTGIPKEALENRICSSILPFLNSSERSNYQEKYCSLLHGAEDFECTVRIPRPRGRGVGWFAVHGRRVRYGNIDRIYVIYSDITNEKRLESIRQDERQILEQALDMAHILVWEYDLKTHYATQLETATGEAERTLLKLPLHFGPLPEYFLDRIDARDRAKYLDMFRAVVQGRSAATDIRFSVPGEAEPRCERFSYIVLRDDRGRPRKAFGMGQNITRQRRLEENYQKEMQMLRQSSPSNLLAKAHFSLTENRTLHYEANDERAISFGEGMAYDLFVERVTERALEPEAQEQLRETLDRHRLIARYEDGEQSFTLEYKAASPNHRASWLTLTVNTFSPRAGEVESFLYAYDVTNEALGRSIIGRLPELGFDLLGMVDVRRNIFIADHSSFRTAGADVGKGDDFAAYIRRHIEEHIPAAAREEAFQALSMQSIQSHLTAATMYEYSYDYVEQKELRRKRLQFCYLDDDQEVIFFCRNDITEQHQRDIAQMERLHEALAAAERAGEAKTMFLASISHDMRTPLNGIIGFTRLAMETEDTAKKQDYLQKIKFSGELLLSLVNDTLELSRIESGRYVLMPEKNDFAEVLDGVIVPVRASASEKDVHLAVDIAAPPRPSLNVDKLKFQEIILNLLSNAVKFTAPGGAVVFSVDFPSPAIGGCNARFIVQDTGIGISQDFIGKIFEPFMQERTAKTQNIAGTGLGLTIVKRVVDRMGGSITVESELGVGTKFTVLLPLEFIDEAGAATRMNLGAETDFRGGRVLLCEDNALNTEIARTLLEDRGLSVVCAANGREGVEAFRASAPGEFAAVFMDIRMPEMDGYEAACCIRVLDRSDAATVPIIAMTADAYAEDIKRCHDVGMNDHIAKPIDPVKLFNTLAKWRR